MAVDDFELAARSRDHIAALQVDAAAADAAAEEAVGFLQGPGLHRGIWQEGLSSDARMQEESRRPFWRVVVGGGAEPATASLAAASVAAGAEAEQAALIWGARRALAAEQVQPRVSPRGTPSFIPQLPCQPCKQSSGPRLMVASP